jgi:hypothetical protein
MQQLLLIEWLCCCSDRPSGMVPAMCCSRISGSAAWVNARRGRLFRSPQLYSPPLLHGSLNISGQLILSFCLWSCIELSCRYLGLYVVWTIISLSARVLGNNWHQSRINTPIWQFIFSFLYIDPCDSVATDGIVSRKISMCRVVVS